MKLCVICKFCIALIYAEPHTDMPYRRIDTIRLSYTISSVLVFKMLRKVKTLYILFLNLLLIYCTCSCHFKCWSTRTPKYFISLVLSITSSLFTISILWDVFGRPALVGAEAMYFDLLIFSFRRCKSSHDLILFISSFAIS